MITEAKRMQQAETYYFAKKLAEIKQMNDQNEEKVINLGIGSPDLPPPSEVIAELASAAQRPDVHAYQSYKGLPELSSAWTNWYKTHFDVKLNPATDILPLIGSKEGVMHLSMTYLNEGDQVLVPNPGYPAYAMTAKLAGAEVVYFDLKEELGWLPDLNEIGKLDLSRVKMMWLNYPNMPTGGKAGLEFFNEVVNFGAAHNIMICHDNPYTFILNEQPCSILQADNAHGNAIELTSLSKNYNMAGWRIGAIAGSKEVIDAVMKFKSNMDSGMFKPLQLAAIKALEQGQDWFDYLNGEYTKRKAVAMEIMEALDCVPLRDGAGMFVWARIPEHVSHAEAMADDILYNAKVFITPGHIFGSMGARYIRISLCSDVPTLQKALSKVLTLKTAHA